MRSATLTVLSLIVVAILAAIVESRAKLV